MNAKKIAALALSAALLAAPAYADGFGVYEWSARGVGMAGAMMFSDEASLIAYNPAAITQFDEKGNFSAAITYIAPRGEAEFMRSASEGGPFTEHNKNNPAYVPSMFYARKIQDNAWFGMGLFPRFGLKATYEPGWYGRYSNRNAEFTSVSLTPVIAWKLFPTLSMSLGGELMYASLKMDRSFKDSGLDGKMDLDGDDWGCGWNVGLNWEATEKLSLAFLYRSEVKQTIRGDVKISDLTYSVFPLGSFDTTGKGSIHLPESYTFGVGWKFDDRTRAEFDAIRTNWSSYDALTIDMKLPSTLAMILGPNYVSSEAKNWTDGWRYQFGIEHKLNERWTVRAGFVYDECSSENPATADFMVPTGIRRTYTVGASYRVKKVEYSFGYGYMDVGDKFLEHGGADDEPAYVKHCDSHIIALGVRIDI